MLLDKWCQFLMRMMSPLSAGLICFLLIEGSLSSSPHSRDSHANYSIHPAASAEVDFNKHAVNSSFAKDYKFHRTRLSTEFPRYVRRNPSSYRPLFQNGSGKIIGNKSRTIPNLSFRPIFEDESGKSNGNKSRTIPHLSFRPIFENESGKSNGNKSRTIPNLSFRPIFENESGNSNDNKSRTIPHLNLSSRPIFENDSGERSGNKSRTILNLSRNPRPIIENGSSESISNKRGTIPNMSLSSRFKVRNGSDVNSTIVFLPRYSRAMANFSKISTHQNLQPIIVSSHRRVLIDPKHYILRSELDTKLLSRRDIASNLRPSSKNRGSSQIFTTAKPRKVHLKFRDTTPASKNNKTNSFQKFGTLFKTDTSVEPLSESTAFIKIKNQNKNGPYTKKDSSISPILPFVTFRNQTTRNVSQNHRRQGRNFNFNKDSVTREEETSSEIIILQPTYTETPKPSFGSSSEISDLFNYAYFSGRQRDSVLTNSPQPFMQKPKDSTLLPTSVFIPFEDYKSSYSEKKANNLTIYEILKPRLKGSGDELSKLSNQTSAMSKYDNLLIQNQEVMDSILHPLSTPLTTVSDRENTDNITPASNGIEHNNRSFVNSMVILPSRSDSNYAVEYVMVNRSNLAIVSTLNPNETDSDKNIEFGKRNSNNSQINHHEQLAKPKSIAEIVDPQEEYITESYILRKDLLRLNLEQNVNSTKSLQKVIPTSPHNLPQGNISTDDTNYMTQLYESDSMRKIKMPVNDTSRKESHLPREKDLLRLKLEGNINVNKEVRPNETSRASPNPHEESIFFDDSEYMTQLYESDSIREPKMSADRTPIKNLKLDSKMFYDYFAKKPIGNVTLQDFPYPEFRPGNMFRYSDIYQRKPILDMVFARPTPVFKLAKPGGDLVTQESIITPTTFNSLRTSVRVLSTFYPNRMQDVTMKFGNRVESTTLPTQPLNEFRSDIDFDDDEYRDAIDPGFTMEKLAYLLIGTCCGLSILCLFVVVIAIKCRRSIVEKRLKAQFRKRMYYHEKMKDMATPWQQQMFDHFMYLHRRPGETSCSTSATDSCNCRCVTWSLGARNLDSTRPLCSPNRSSSYLCGQKKLPFGAASTLRYESMLGRKRTSPEANHHKADSPNTDSSHENDSLDMDSADSREGDGPKQCTCIDYNVWPMAPSNVPRGFFTVCPNVGRFNSGNCSQHPPVELRTIARDVPPPVTGSNYLDRSEGVVYWSSNEERLI